MRIALTSFVVLMGLMISVAATADHHEAAAEETPPVEAAPADTTIAAPASPETGEGEAAEGDAQED
jgi:hypothetical protein